MTMNQEQFERESNYRIAFAIFQKLFNRGLLTSEQLDTARQKLIDRFQPPIGRLAAR